VAVQLHQTHQHQGAAAGGAGFNRHSSSSSSERARTAATLRCPHTLPAPRHAALASSEASIAVPTFSMLCCQDGCCDRALVVVFCLLLSRWLELLGLLACGWFPIMAGAKRFCSRN